MYHFYFPAQLINSSISKCWRKNHYSCLNSILFTKCHLLSILFSYLIQNSWLLNYEIAFRLSHHREIPVYLLGPITASYKQCKSFLTASVNSTNQYVGSFYSNRGLIDWSRDWLLITYVWSLLIALFILLPTFTLMSSSIEYMVRFFHCWCRKVWRNHAQKHTTNWHLHLIPVNIQ